MDSSDANGSAERWRLLALRAWALIGISAIAVAALYLLFLISRVLVPFIFAAIVVFVLRRPVNILKSKGVPRGAAVAICYIVAAVVLTFVGIFVVPPLVAQTRDFLEEFPRYYEAARDLWFDVQVEYTRLAIPDWVEEAVLVSRDSLTQQIAAWSRTVASAVVLAGGQLASFVFNLFLSLALAFFALRDLPTLKQEVLVLGGGKRRGDMIEVIERVTLVFEGWIRGQSLIAVIVGVATWLGLQLLGVPYALIIGLIAGVTNLIPYLGPVVGGVIAAISASFVSPTLVLYTVIYIVVIQQLESMFLQPKIMSDRVRLHPVVVVFSLLVGATIWGLLGMLLAVPVAGMISTVFVYYFEKHTDSQLATERGALFRTMGGEPSGSESAAGMRDEPEPESDDASGTANTP